MGHLEKTRILLQGSTSERYELCFLAHGNSRGFPYIKIGFPAFRSAKKFTENVGFRESDGMTVIPQNANSINCNPIEVSYHYLEGVKHLNTIERFHLSQDRTFPILSRTTEPVLICRTSLVDFSILAKIDSEVEGDIVLDNVRLPTIFGFYCGYRNDDLLPFIDRPDGKSHCLTIDDDENLAITITEYYTPNLSANTIHLNYDPFAHNK